MADASPTTKQVKNFDEQTQLIRGAAASIENAIASGEQQTGSWPAERDRLTRDLSTVVQTWVAALRNARVPVSFAPLHAEVKYLAGFKGRMRRHPQVAAFRRYLLGLRLRLFLWRMLIVMIIILGFVLALIVLAISATLAYTFLSALLEQLFP